MVVIRYVAVVSSYLPAYQGPIACLLRVGNCVNVATINN